MAIDRDERREIKEFALSTAGGLVNRRMWKLREMVISLCDELERRDEEDEKRERKLKEDLGLMKHHGFVLNSGVEYETGLTMKEASNGMIMKKVDGNGEGDE